MGKALGEIGLRRAWRYGVGQVQLAIIKCLLMPPQCRVWWLRCFGTKIGRGSIVHPVTFVNLYRKGFKGFRLGRECFIGEECLLDLAEAITLGDQVTLAARTSILTHLNVGFKDHPLQGKFPARTGAVSIGNGSFVGAGCCILPGIKIGERVFVGAGSVVTKDLPDGVVVARNPAKEIGRLDD